MKMITTCSANRTTRVVSCFLIMSLLWPTGPAVAAGRNGATLRVSLKDGTDVSGELLRVRHLALTLIQSPAASRREVSLSDARTVRILKPSRALAGMLGGFLGVALPLGILGVLSGYGGDALGASAKLGAIGAATGGAMGAAASGDLTVVCEGRSDTELAAIALKLAGLARESAGTGLNPAPTTAAPGAESASVDGLRVPEAEKQTRSGARAAIPAPRGRLRSYRRFHVSLVPEYSFSQPGRGLDGLLDSLGFGDDYSWTSGWFGPGTAAYPRLASGAKLNWRALAADVSISRRLAVGVVASPGRSAEAEGRSAMINRIGSAGSTFSTSLEAGYRSQTYFLTASLFPVPDGFLETEAVKLSLGVGVSRTDGFVRGGTWGPGWDERRASAKLAPAWLARVEYMHFVGSRLSLNVAARYTWSTVSVGGERVSCAYYFREPGAPSTSRGAFTVDVPTRTINDGGFGIGAGLGFHF
jgi:hypothetical protein